MSEHRELVMVPRGARWLAVGWDFSQMALQEFQSQSHDNRLRLRVQSGADRESGYTFLVLHPKATSWYVPLTRELAFVHVEFGYFDRNQPGHWIRLAAGSWPHRNHHGPANSGQGVPFPYNHVESWDASPNQGEHTRVNLHYGMGMSPLAGLSSGAFYSPKPSAAHLTSEVASATTGRLHRDAGLEMRSSAQADRDKDSGGAQVVPMKAACEMDHTFHGRVEDGATVYFNGKPVPVKNGGFSFRVSSSEGMKVYELSVISADGLRRQIHRYQLTGHVEVLNLPEIVSGSGF